MIGKTLGKYQITAYLGSGGMARVYKAYHADLDRHVAIKVMKAAEADAPGYLQRFKIEARSIAALRHPHIIQIFDYDIDPETGQPYMVMEFLQGGTLNDYLTQRQGQLLSLTETVQIVGEIGSALAYAHEHGVLHRDVKPGNIMRDATGRFVLTDFGLAKMAAGPTVSSSNSVAGTPAYMAPEQALGEAVDARADLYALGGVLFQLLTGRLPYRADSTPAMLLMIVNAPVPDPRRINPAVPPSLAQIVMRCLAKKRTERYAVLGDFLAALQHAATALGLTVNMPINPVIVTDRPATDPSAATVIVGPAAVDVSAEQVEVGGDVVGRDKIVQNIYPSVDTKFSPFQVPREVPHFVGRKIELSALTDQLTQPNNAPIVAICGLGGMGKTTLAIELAYQVRRHFSDGVLWADAATTMPPAILYNWARAYGCDFSALPDVNTRAAAFREVLADRQVLTIIDDVRDAEQVRLLLPGGMRNAVLLTTRNRDLAEALNAHVILLTELTAPEGREMLTRMLGKERVVREEDAADEICQLLLNLPLALEIAASRLNSRPRWKLADMAGRLRDEKRRLHELKIGNLEVRASFLVSWNMLDEEMRRVFPLLAVFEGRAFTVAAVSTVAEDSEPATADWLDALAALSLIAPEGAIHYRLHPLLTDFAREKLPEAAVDLAYARMAHYYLNYAVQYTHDPIMLELEWNNLLAGEQAAYRLKQWPMVIAYTDGLAGTRFTRARFAEARQSYQRACEATQALHDRAALASALSHQARACIELSDYDEAEELLTHSLQLYTQVSDQQGVARAQYHLGRIAIERANYDQAQQLLTESRLIREKLGDQAGVADILYILADIPYYQGDYTEAERLGLEALNIQQAVGDKFGCIRTLGLLADIALKQGDPELGEKHCQRALDLCEEMQEQGERAVILYILSEARRQLGDLESARDYAERSLAQLRSMGDRKMQANALWRLSQIDADRKDYPVAVQESLHSLSLFRELGDGWSTVYVLLHLGDMHHALNQSNQARERWSEALGQIDKTQQHPLTKTLQERLGLTVDEK
jgi:serine/threonine protein kinase/tetratricopeptide (TPR) repeat protein